jgi:GNAT superfamily N-acetyltransferase
VVEIISIADANIEEAGAAMARAFWSDPLMGKTLPDEGERAQRLARFLSNGLRYAQLVGVAYVPAGIPAGAAFGWKLPSVRLSSEESVAVGIESTVDTLGVAATQRFTSIIDHIEEHMAELIPPPGWLLAALAVDPAHQKQGIGGALVQALMERAQAEALPLCLWTANPANVNFYTGLGFDLVGEGIEPSNGLSYWIFKR